ncbi:MAG TPA: peptide chain release factor 2 [Spirochaetota bacterium]|nr:peptide chain release factor 2 [Spirochaetota bacterium]HPG50863.1 peptide chain release factor 2 [Spirochaetota bacterium]HPN11372.1 peptide chain release factor 2 [Spirochaetota bacterium]HQL81131.1 peptide chain release factor 2 [Spirochaetota bacterium]
MEERDYRESQRDLKNITEMLDQLYASVNMDALKRKMAELQQETLKENFWQNKELFTKTNQEISNLKRRIVPFDELKGELQEAAELFDMALQERDSSVLDEICGTIASYKKKFDELETLELLSGEDDFNNAFITIHPGAGGTESQDWANMLFRMYFRWGEQKGFAVEVIDYTPGEEAGIKSATMLVKGDYSFGLLRSERGIHRLVRISPFDANKRRHTSFASVEVIPEVSEDIDLEIKESDLRIDTYRSSGAGGQHVNKTDSAVRITHIPTGIVTQCQNERSQHKNKAFAMKVLKARLYELRKREFDEKQQEKIGQKKDISWGNQIRSYVFQPYTLVKDHRTGEETGSVDFVFDGDIDRFIYAFLRGKKTGDTGLPQI